MLMHHMVYIYEMEMLLTVTLEYKKCAKTGLVQVIMRDTLRNILWPSINFLFMLLLHPSVVAVLYLDSCFVFTILLNSWLTGLLALPELLKTSSWSLCQGVFISCNTGISDAKFSWHLCGTLQQHALYCRYWRQKRRHFVMTNTIEISHNVRPLNAFCCRPYSQTALFDSSGERRKKLTQSQ